MESLGTSPGALPSRGLVFFLPGAWFSSWYVISIDTGHVAQSPQSSPRWSPASKMEPVLSVASFRDLSVLYFLAFALLRVPWHWHSFCIAVGTSYMFGLFLQRNGELHEVTAHDSCDI